MCDATLLEIFRDVVVTALGLVLLVGLIGGWAMSDDDDEDEFGGYP